MKSTFMIIVFIIFLFMLVVCAYIKFLNQYKIVEKKQNIIDELNGIIIRYSIQNDILRRQLREEREIYNKMGNVSDEIKEAVKYAMICAHPDNGGDNNTFIKYRKLYQSINGKR